MREKVDVDSYSESSPAERVGPVFRKQGEADFPVIQIMLPSDRHSPNNRADLRAAVLNWAHVRKPGGSRRSLITEKPFEGGPFQAEDARARITVQADGDRLWCFEVEHVGTGAAPRLWKLEAFVAGRDTYDEIGVRVFCERRPESAPSNTPALVKTLVQNHGLLDAGRAVSDSADACDLEGYQQFLNLLLSKERRLPVVVVSQEARRYSEPRYCVSPGGMAEAVQGLAHVVALSADAASRLTGDLGKELSVFGGAVRIYQPGFRATADKMDHFLYLRERVSRADAQHRIEDVIARRLRNASVDRAEKLQQWPQVHDVTALAPQTRGPLGGIKRALGALFGGRG